MSNIDWVYFQHMYANKALVALFFPAIALGGFVPILAPLFLFVHSKKYKSESTLVVTLAVLQSVVLGSFISSLYKFFTGRSQPDLHHIHTNMSHAFHLGFGEHGIFWGWPSSHTTIAFAMALTLVTLFPLAKKAHAVLVVYALYIGVGVSFTIHWFSDFVAGAIIGSVIGIVVGASFFPFLARIQEKEEQDLESKTDEAPHGHHTSHVSHLAHKTHN